MQYCAVDLISTMQWKLLVGFNQTFYWTAVKHILKYLTRMRNFMLVYLGGDMNPLGYTDSDF